MPILTRIERFRTVIPIRIHRWLRNDAQSLKRCPIVFQGHPSILKVTQAKKVPILAQTERFRTVIPVWIHSWLRNDAQSLKYYRNRYSIVFQGHLSKFQGHTGKKVPILTRIERFRTEALVWIHRWLRNDERSLKYYRRGALLFFKVIHQISRSQGQKKCRFWPNWPFPDCNSSLNSQMSMMWWTKLELEVLQKRWPIVFQGHRSIFKVPIFGVPDY